MNSLLAILETVASSAVLAWLCIRSQSATPALMASLVAPILLLRSPVATLYAIRLRKWIGINVSPAFAGKLPVKGLIAGMALLGYATPLFWYVADLEPSGFLGLISWFLMGAIVGAIAGAIVPAAVYLLLIIGSGALIRLTSVLAATLTRPRAALLRDPVNWRKLCFQVSLLSFPAVSPDAEASGHRGNAQDWRQLVSATRLAAISHYDDEFSQSSTGPKSTSDSFLGRMVAWIARSLLCYIYPVLLALLLYVCAIAYRFTVKSTCLIYLPLLYFSGHAVRSRSNVQFCVRTIRDSRSKLIASLTVVSHIALPLIILFAMGYGFTVLTAMPEVTQALNYFSFIPLQDPNSPSHPISLVMLAKIAGATITFASVPMASWSLKRQRELPGGGTSLCTVVRILLTTRGMLAVYSIIYFVVLLSHLASTKEAHGAFLYVIEHLRELRVDLTPFPNQFPK